MPLLSEDPGAVRVYSKGQGTIRKLITRAYSQIHIKSAESAELSYIVVECVHGRGGVR